MDKAGATVTGSRLALQVIQPMIQKALDAGEAVSITINNSLGAAA